MMRMRMNWCRWWTRYYRYVCGCVGGIDWHRVDLQPPTPFSRAQVEMMIRARIRCLAKSDDRSNVCPLYNIEK